jgi:uncharacterized protein (TIGR00304 family)
MQVQILQSLGWVFLIIGILLVFISILSGIRSSDSEEVRTQSKGVILLGPIPIVWGYGRKGWMIAGIVGIIILLIWFIFFL